MASDQIKGDNFAKLGPYSIYCGPTITLYATLIAKKEKL